MAIYLLFIQHIMYSLSSKGSAAIVVPTGFITAQSGIEKKIREKLVKEKMIKGVVSMPSNIFATTGTNVSVLFLDKSNDQGDVILVDASKLGTTVKEGKNNKTILSAQEEQLIIDTFNNKNLIDGFSVKVSYEQLAEKNCSLSAGQYFDIKVEYSEINQDEFNYKIQTLTEDIQILFNEAKSVDSRILTNLTSLKYE